MTTITRWPILALTILGCILIYAGILAATTAATAAGCVLCALALVVDWQVRR